MRYWKRCPACDHEFAGAKGDPCPECGATMTELVRDLKRWADTLPDGYPACPPADQLDQQTVARQYCEFHEVVLVQDNLGRDVCVACIVEEALG